MNTQRGHWYLLTGIVIGAVLGLLVAWVVAPVQYTETNPATLRADFKDEYRYLIAASYSVTGNLGRARARLGLLNDGNPVHALGDQAQRMLANNTSQDVVGKLADLSQALQGAVTPDASPTPQSASVTESSSTPPGISTAVDTPITPIEGDTPLPSSTDSSAENTATSQPAPAFTVGPHPTFTPTFTPGPPFQLVNQATSCDPAKPGLLQVTLQDAQGKPAAGIELIITWLGGEEHFFSGLKTELGNGYADFVMSPDVEYALSLNNGITRITGLSASVCTSNDGSNYPGGIHLDFKQP